MKNWLKLSSILFLFLSYTGAPGTGLCGESRWLFVETIEGVDLFRARTEAQGLLPFKATAVLDVPYQNVVKALVDAEVKNTWAPKLKTSTLHRQLSPNQFEYSEYYTTPFPFYDREFLLLGSVEYQRDRILFSASNSANNHLADTDHLRANVAVLEFLIIPLSPQKTRVEFTFSGDMGGWIPSFVKTIIQKKWPVRFIQALNHHIKDEMVVASKRYEHLDKSALTLPFDD